MWVTCWRTTQLYDGADASRAAIGPAYYHPPLIRGADGPFRLNDRDIMRMKDMPYSLITFEKEDRVGLIRLNRPDDGNALIPDMARELLDAAIRCDEEPEIHAVVLTGNGEMFCAGGDLKAFAAQGEKVSQYIRDITQAFHAAINIIEKVDGAVLGNGNADKCLPGSAAHGRNITQIDRQ